jgi:glutamine amidotransferase
VGAFGDGMVQLRARGWDDALKLAVREEGRPLLGICLGMQLLAEVGTEHGQGTGLGWIPGRVTRLPGGSTDVRVPHIGWNDVTIVRSDGLYAGLNGQPDFYFVHSYRFEPADEGDVSGWCEHGTRFAASLEHGSIWATQFHPEKSQGPGLVVLRNFLAAARRWRDMAAGTLQDVPAGSSAESREDTPAGSSADGQEDALSGSPFRSRSDALSDMPATEQGDRPDGEKSDAVEVAPC